jgi:hypothetical protein
MSHFVLVIENEAARRDGVKDLNQRGGLFPLRKQRPFDANPPLRIPRHVLQQRGLMGYCPVSEDLCAFKNGVCRIRRSGNRRANCVEIGKVGYSLDAGSPNM